MVNIVEHKESDNKPSVFGIIIVIFFIGIILFNVLISFNSEGESKSNPYNKIYNYSYEAYGATLEMYFVVSDDYCSYYVGDLTRYSNSCSVSQNSSGEYILKLDVENYKYIDGDFVCTNCSNNAVFKYYKQLNN